MGSLEIWNSDEEDAIMERSSRSRRSRGKSPARTLNHSVSILSNLSEMSEAVVFGTRWYLDEPEAKHDQSSDLPGHIDDDWFDDPSDDLGASARSSARSSTIAAGRASGSDNERERPHRRRSTRADVDAGGGSSSSASTGSRPIAIPRSRQNSSASATTFPEALSARGERQGGYFPLHEDPKTRVRHTHPFYRDVKTYDMGHSVEEVDTGADADVDMPKPRSQYQLSNSTRDNDSYWLISDDDEDSEPFRSASMGKYYPGVYERRQAQKRSGRPVDPIPSSSRTPATQPRTPRIPKYRPRPKTPVLAPRSTTAPEYIPPLKLSSAE
ncbi:hypothetical protein J3F83DRAFT_391606 [Trichoderma novae-zelandiae]